MSTRPAVSSSPRSPARAWLRGWRTQWSALQATPISGAEWARPAAARSSASTRGIRRSTGSSISIGRRCRPRTPPELEQRPALLLVRQQLPLPIQPPGIAAERPIAADDAVAGDQHRYMIVPVRGAHGTHRRRLPDGRSDLGIASGLPDRDLAQLAPNRLLEGRASDVDGKLVNGSRTLDRFKRTFDQLLQSSRVLDDRRLRKESLQRIDTVVEGQAANALARRRDQHPAQRAVEVCPADGLAASAVAPGRRGHPQPLLRVAVEAARA